MELVEAWQSGHILPLLELVQAYRAFLRLHPFNLFELDCLQLEPGPERGLIEWIVLLFLPSCLSFS